LIGVFGVLMSKNHVPHINLGSFLFIPSTDHESRCFPSLVC